MTRLTDAEIAEMMIVYGGSFVSRLGNLFRHADAENRAILLAAFPHVWSEYAELAILTDKDEPRRCPVCGCYQVTYQGDRQVCADCGRE